MDSQDIKITPTDRIRKCLSNEDDKEAFSCVKRTVREQHPEDGCQVRLVLFTKNGCPYCAEEKSALAEDLASGLIQEISMDTPEGKALADKNGVEYVPDIAVIDCEGNLVDIAP